MKQVKKNAKGQTVVTVNSEGAEIESKNVVKVKNKASVKRLLERVKKATWARNEEHNGIEISFTEKPSKAVREVLKGAGFRWHNKKQIWYAKETEARVEIAEMVCA